MALRDLTGAVDFGVLNGMTGGDDAINEEVLGLSLIHISEPTRPY